jgi:hypothetical protein
MATSVQKEMRTALKFLCQESFKHAHSVFEQDFKSLLARCSSSNIRGADEYGLLQNHMHMTDRERSLNKLTAEPLVETDSNS